MRSGSATVAELAGGTATAPVAADGTSYREPIDAGGFVGGAVVLVALLAGLFGIGALYWAGTTPLAPADDERLFMIDWMGLGVSSSSWSDGSVAGAAASPALSGGDSIESGCPSFGVPGLAVGGTIGAGATAGAAIPARRDGGFQRGASAAFLADAGTRAGNGLLVDWPGFWPNAIWHESDEASTNHANFMGTISYGPKEHGDSIQAR